MASSAPDVDVAAEVAAVEHTEAESASVAPMGFEEGVVSRVKNTSLMDEVRVAEHAVACIDTTEISDRLQ